MARFPAPQAERPAGNEIVTDKVGETICYPHLVVSL